MDYPTLVLRALHSCQTFEPAASSVDPRHKGEDDAGYLGEADQTYLLHRRQRQRRRRGFYGHVANAVAGGDHEDLLAGLVGQRNAAV